MVTVCSSLPVGPTVATLQPVRKPGSMPITVRSRRGGWSRRLLRFAAKTWMAWSSAYSPSCPLTSRSTEGRSSRSYPSSMASLSCSADLLPGVRVQRRTSCAAVRVRGVDLHLQAAVLAPPGQRQPLVRLHRPERAPELVVDTVAAGFVGGVARTAAGHKPLRRERCRTRIRAVGSSLTCSAMMSRAPASAAAASGTCSLTNSTAIAAGSVFASCAKSTSASG